EVWWYVDTDFEEVKVIDEYTVRLTLVNPISRPPMYWCPILPKHIWEPYAEDLLEYDNKDAIGSGPFKLKEFRSEEYVLLEANEEYWGGRPYVDEVLLIAYANEEAQILALKKGDIQTIGYRGLSSPAAAEKLRGEPNIEIGEYPGLGIWWLSIDLYKEGPLQDLNVRKAIAYAINRDRIIDTVYMGYAEKADSFVYPELDIHNPNLPQYDYNPTLAAQILDEAGYVDIDGDGVRETPEGDDLSFEMITASAWPDAIKIASLIKEDLAAIGINIKVSPLDEDVYYTMVYEPTESEYDIAIHEEEPGILVDWIWYFCLDPEDMGAGWNTAYYYNPEFDELYFEQVSEFDPEKRKQLIWQMQELLAEDLPYIFLVRPKELVPYRTDKFEGYVGTIGGLSSWVNPWTYLKVHLKAAPAPPPPPAPGPAIPMTAIAGGIVALVIIVGVAYYAVKRRGS
ncbi:MAG TPA: peptide ABC transporter substrate-binding protein, partial [Candidatus Bathyarchaeota archaeon]|nr:peptide ABC transporter substrate-binding protein [Candidatus Bathyarchaeota archaeon]